MGTTHRDHTARDVTLRERDLAILHAVQRAPRASWEQIAACLADGSTARGVAARWAALREAGVVWLAAYPGPRWWATHPLAWVTVAAAPRDVDALAASGRVMSLDLAYGGLAVASVAGRDSDDLGEWLTRWPGAHRVDIAVHLHTSASRWRVGALPGVDDSRTTDLPDAAGSRPPDHLVRDVLAALAPDPRASVAAIADALGQPLRTARRWLARTLRDGDIRIRVEVPAAAVGRQVAAHWWLRAPRPDVLAAALVQERDVRWIASIVPWAGDAAVLAAVWAPSRDSLYQLVTRVGRACPDVATDRLALTWRPAKRLGWRVDGGRRRELIPLAI